MANGIAAVSDIGDIAINPEAEARSNGQANSAAQAEENFYEESGVQYQLQHNQQNLGWLGKFFGTNTMAPTHIAGVVILMCLAMLVITFFFPVPEVGEARKIVVGLMSSAMAYIFGASSRR
jgi:hypothetical protein